MPTTASGTNYTVYTATLPGANGVVTWGLADAIVTAPNIPVVLHTHGAGSAANVFANSPSWKLIREWIIDHGWAWIEGSGGAVIGYQNWGNVAARTAYLAYLDYVGDRIDIGKKVILSRSMGGLVGAWLYAKSNVEFDGWINNSGVSTWFNGDDTNNPAVPSIKRSARTYHAGSAVVLEAWNVSTLDALSAAILAVDGAPELWPASVWEDGKILNCYGTADVSVPWAPRGAAKLREIWAGIPLVDEVSVTVGGGHDFPGSYTDVPAMGAFLLNIDGGSTPPVEIEKNIYRAYNGYLIGFNGDRFKTGPRPNPIYI